MIVENLMSKKFNVKSIYNSIIYIKNSQKTEELISFIIWEILSLVKYYKKVNILPVSNHAKDNDELKVVSWSGRNFRQEALNLDIFLLIEDGDFNKFYVLESDSNKIFRNSSTKAKVELIQIFEHKIEGLYILPSGMVFLVSFGKFYKYNGIFFTQVLQLSTNESVVLKNAITEIPGKAILIGEYANILEDNKWKFVGYIYLSKNGIEWTKIDFLKKAKINKHIHLVKWIAHLNCVIVTDGDNQKNIWRVELNESEFEKNKGSDFLKWEKINLIHLNMGGYTGITELKNKILLDTDYLGGSNFFVSTNNLKSFDKRIFPKPYQRSVVERIIKRQDRFGNIEIWASIHFPYSNQLNSLIMFSNDEGASWNKVLEYNGSKHYLSIINDTSSDSCKEIYIRVHNKATKNRRIMVYK